MQLPTVFALLFLAIGTIVRSDYRNSSVSYRNLYGFAEDWTPIKEVLASLATGVQDFLRDARDFESKEPNDFTPCQNQEFDFLVIGGGSAGAVISARLTEEPLEVLLIEAGPSESLFMDVPMNVDDLQFSDEINWKYQTESSTDYCLGMTDRKCNFPRGKVMGGSSVLNHMIASRGHPRDYDDWANVGWSWDELLEYFKKLENMEIDELKFDKQSHGTDGPMYINYPPYRTPLAESFIEAGLEMGYPLVDYNDGKQGIGFSYVQATMRNGTRYSTNQAYLCQAKERENLWVTRMSHVNRILIDPEKKVAYGVEFTKSGVKHVVKARKEVVLCAGAIGSPQILMLSGVGPAAHLRDLSIGVLQDAPVGENLQDHVAYGGLLFLVDQPSSILREDLENPINPYLRDFFTRRKGPLTIPGGCEALAFIDVNNDDEDEDTNSYPDVELLFIGASLFSDLTFQRNNGISDEYWEKTFANVEDRYSWTIFPILTRPKSRGKILLRNNDPEAKPKIYPHYLEDPEDVRVMIGGIRAAIEISKTKAMRRFNSKLYEFVVPGCENFEYDSDDYWECAVRTFTVTVNHQVGTCKMANDTTGVVDSRLRVKGIKGLRVADASIMPNVITGHTNVPVIMIAEKAANMIKEDNNDTESP